MPCNTDHMNPTERERARKEAAVYLNVARELLHFPPDPLAEEYAADYYGGKDDRCVAALCDLLRDLDDKERDALLYGDARSRVRRDLATWWEEHVVADKSAKATATAIAVASERRRQVAAQGRAKLTDSELGALGLKREAGDAAPDTPWSDVAHVKTDPTRTHATAQTTDGAIDLDVERVWFFGGVPLRVFGVTANGLHRKVKLDEDPFVLTFEEREVPS